MQQARLVAPSTADETRLVNPAHAYFLKIVQKILKCSKIDIIQKSVYQQM